MAWRGRRENVWDENELLTGLQKEVFAVRFDPTGQNIASGSFDRSICEKPPLKKKRTPLHYHVPVY